MTSVLAAGVLAIVISIVAGPRFIATLRRLRIGQNIREEGPEGHHVDYNDDLGGDVHTGAGRYVASLFDHKEQRYMRGHVLLLAAVMLNGVVLPWRIELWKPRGAAGGRFIKLTNLAARMIRTSHQRKLPGLKRR